MFRIDDPSAANALPTPEAAGTPGYFTEGNPGGGVAATLLRASWLNMLQEEIMAILAAASISPSKTTYNQLLAAIRAVAIAQFTGINATNGYVKLPNGVIIQWGVATVAASSTAAVSLPTTFPTAAFMCAQSGYATTFNPATQPYFGATVSTTQITFQNMYSASNASIGWIAIGN